MHKIADRQNREILTRSADETVREGLAEVPLSDLLALRDRVGSKEFSKVYHNQTKTCDPVTTQKEKDRPPEFSSKKRTRPYIKKQAPHKRQRDPRFDERAGAFNEDSFGRAYSFLEEVRQRERCEVEREVQSAGTDEDTRKLRTLLDRMKAQERARKERARDREVQKSWMREEREKVRKGKKRFHLKKSALRNIQLENRLARSRGRQEIDKRRKRIEKKSRRKIPERRDI